MFFGLSQVLKLHGGGLGVSLDTGGQGGHCGDGLMRRREKDQAVGCVDGREGMGSGYLFSLLTRSLKFPFLPN